MTEKEWKRIAIRSRVSDEVEERLRSSKVFAFVITIIFVALSSISFIIKL